MTTLPFWLLVTLLIVLLLAARFVAWRVRRALTFAGPRLGLSLRRIDVPKRPGDYVAWRWPGGYRWLASRVTVDRFSGLPLTLMVLLATCLAFLFGGFVAALFHGGGIIQIDQKIGAMANLLRNDWFLRLFGLITSLGDAEVLVAITLVAVGFLWVHKRAYYIPGLLFTVIGSTATTYISKYVISRDRPDFETFASVVTPSFPSGHTSGAVAVYGFIIYVMTRDLSATRPRFELIYWGTALILLIAASRVILGVHYASDVIAGILVGGFWLIAGVALTEYLRERAA